VEYDTGAVFQLKLATFKALICSFWRRCSSESIITLDIDERRMNMEHT